MGNRNRQRPRVKSPGSSAKPVGKPSPSRKRTRDRAREEAACLLGRRSWHAPLDMQPVRDAAEALESSMSAAAERLLRLAGGVPRFDPSILWGCEPLWGPKWDGHPFSTPAVLRVMAMTEPQFTRELAFWLGAQNREGQARRRSFVQAILQAAGDPNAGRWKDLCATGRIAVEAEVVLNPRRAAHAPKRNSGRSIADLIFQGENGSNKATIIVEAKIGSPYDPSQLAKYHRNANKDEDRIFSYIFLSLNPPAEIEPPWRKASWKMAMALFEAELRDRGDQDPSFRLFRSQALQRIWQ